MTEDSWAANQLRVEPIQPTPAHDHTPTTGTDQANAAAEAPGAEPATQPQAGVPDGAVTDVTPAPGTSEAMRAVDGAYLTEAGPGGADFDTDERPVPGRPQEPR